MQILRANFKECILKIDFLTEILKCGFPNWVTFSSLKLRTSKEPSHALRDKVKQEHFNDRNKAYLKRIGDLREKYEKYAIEHHIPVAHFYRNKTFKEIKGSKLEIYSLQYMIL